MNDINWIELLINVILFLIAYYFIYFKSFLKSLGNEVAKLSTREQLTRLEEKVKKDFNEKLESYKNKLSEELSMKIEPLKSDLAKNNITHQIQFSHLHKKRADAVLELYEKIQELHSAMVSWTAPLQPIIKDAEKEKDQRAARVNKAMDNFRNYYLVNRLFFSKKFCTSIDKVFEQYWDKGWDFGYKQARVTSGHITQEFFDEYTKEMSKISTEIREELPKQIEELETEFRKILYVEEEE